jgi:hypothetical protein
VDVGMELTEKLNNSCSSKVIGALNEYKLPLELGQ